MKFASALWKNFSYTVGRMLRETGLGSSLNFYRLKKIKI